MYVRKYYDLLVPLYLFIGLPSKVVVYKRQCTPGKCGFEKRYPTIKEAREKTLSFDTALQLTGSYFFRHT